MSAQHPEVIKATVRLGFSRLDFTFSPAQIEANTLELAWMQEEAQTNPAAFWVTQARLLLKILVSWNLRLKRGGPVVPLTEEGIRTVPVHVCLALWGKISEIMGDPSRGSPALTARETDSSASAAWIYEC